jgi:hypothetical protein
MKENVRTYDSFPRRVVAARAGGGRGVGRCSRFRKCGLPRGRVPFGEGCVQTQQKGRCDERRGPSCHLALPTVPLKAKLALIGNRLSEPLQAAKDGTAGATVNNSPSVGNDCSVEEGVVHALRPCSVALGNEVESVLQQELDLSLTWPGAVGKIGTLH